MLKTQKNLQVMKFLQKFSLLKIEPSIYNFFIFKSCFFLKLTANKPELH